jgi:mRNA-degrading endonuclease toxin of MazEF toxin-antitoxin module
LVLFPHYDLRTAKPRPALVVQANDLGTDLPQVIVAMITSKAFRANHPSRVLENLRLYKVSEFPGGFPSTDAPLLAA